MTVPLVVGNWKMNGGQSDSRQLALKVARELRRKPTRVQVVLAPPFTALAPVAKAIQKNKIALAAQNCHWQENGAFTGEISPVMLAELGCKFVILGHSERRHIFHESDEIISRKVGPVLAQGMRPILCVGETLEERQQNLTGKVITRQLRAALKGLSKDVIENVEIAYEPVWAIGTGQNATAAQVRNVHAQIRRFLASSFGDSTSRRTRILYGGSVKPENADMLAEIDEVNGLLVGGASLQAESFLPIVYAFTK
jgi:triosephosphate isomerase (TIM)